MYQIVSYASVSRLDKFYSQVMENIGKLVKILMMFAMILCIHIMTDRFDTFSNTFLKGSYHKVKY